LFQRRIKFLQWNRKLLRVLLLEINALRNVVYVKKKSILIIKARFIATNELI